LLAANPAAVATIEPARARPSASSRPGHEATRGQANAGMVQTALRERLDKAE